jgi:hypothetical protein
VIIKGWFTSSAVALTEGMGGVVSADLTETTGEAAEGIDSVEFARSVTWSSKEYVAPAVSVPPGIVQVSVAPPLAPEPELAVHCVAAA